MQWHTIYISVRPYFWGPNLTVELHSYTIICMPQTGRTSQLLRTQNETNKKAMADSGRERIQNQWVPESRFTSQNSKIQFFFLFYFFLFCLPIWKQGSTWKFAFLSWWGTMDRNFAINSHPLSTSDSFLQFQCAGSGVSPVGLNLVTRNFRGKK